MPSVGPLEAVIILAIILIVFGVGRLPEVGGALGKAIREFRQASTGADEETGKGESTKKA
jgi:sec-independent protein translocase protein TatA